MATGSSGILFNAPLLVALFLNASTVRAWLRPRRTEYRSNDSRGGRGDHDVHAASRCPAILRLLSHAAALASSCRRRTRRSSRNLVLVAPMLDFSSTTSWSESVSAFAAVGELGQALHRRACVGSPAADGVMRRSAKRILRRDSSNRLHMLVSDADCCRCSGAVLSEIKAHGMRRCGRSNATCSSSPEIRTTSFRPNMSRASDPCCRLTNTVRCRPNTTCC